MKNFLYISLEYPLSKKKKNKNKRRPKKSSYLYCTDSPEQIKTIAMKVFGSIYFSPSSLNDN